MFKAHLSFFAFYFSGTWHHGSQKCRKYGSVKPSTLYKTLKDWPTLNCYIEDSSILPLLVDTVRRCDQIEFGELLPSPNFWFCGFLGLHFMSSALDIHQGVVYTLFFFPDIIIGFIEVKNVDSYNLSAHHYIVLNFLHVLIHITLALTLWGRYF